MKYHITHINLAFTLGMSFTALSRSSASCHHWLGCLICPRIPRKTSWNLLIWGSIWQTGAFFLLIFFLLQFSGHSERTSGKTRGDALISQRNKIPILVLTNLAEEAAAASLPRGSVMLGRSVHCFFCPLLLGWHGRSWHRQAGEGFTDFGSTEHNWYREGRSWYVVPQLCIRSDLRGQRATVPCHDLVRKGWKFNLSKCFYTPTA